MTALRICYALNACVYAAVLFRRPPIAWRIWLVFLIAWTPWLIMEPGYSFTGYWRVLPLALEAVAVVALAPRWSGSLSLLAGALSGLFLMILPSPYDHPGMPALMWYVKVGIHLWATGLMLLSFAANRRPVFAATALWFAFSAWGNAQTSSGDLAAWIHASIIVSSGHFAAAVVWLLAGFGEAHPRTGEDPGEALGSLAHPHPD